MENRPEIIGERDYLLTEQDNITLIDIYFNRIAKAKGKANRNRSLNISVLIAGSLVLYILFGFSLYMSRGTDDTFPGTVLAAAVCYTLLVTYKLILPKLLKIKTDNFRKKIEDTKNTAYRCT